GGGINTVLPLVPQIGMMYLFLSFLEDSRLHGARAFVMDRPMHFPDWLTVFLAQGIGGGINTVLPLVPQIGMMYLFLSFLEDSRLHGAR
ncbi:hypothetical protein, partial [Enterococcus faecium]|uniref:hypothetical protein n=1 Tax=Enterococcus faecium TaxID=1352 RepID=UPI0015C7FEFF